MGSDRHTTTDHILVLDAALERLREVEAVFNDLNVGIAAIHLDATIAALESQMRRARSGEDPLKLRLRPAAPAD